MMWLFLLRSSWLLKAPFLIPDGPGRGLKLWLLWLRLLATPGRTVPGAEGSPGFGLLLLVHSWSRRGAGLLLLALMALAPSLLILMVRLLQLCQQRLDGVVSNTSFPTLWNNIRLKICIFFVIKTKFAAKNIWILKQVKIRTNKHNFFLKIFNKGGHFGRLPIFLKDTYWTFRLLRLLLGMVLLLLLLL